MICKKLLRSDNFIKKVNNVIKESKALLLMILFILLNWVFYLTF